MPMPSLHNFAQLIGGSGIFFRGGDFGNHAERASIEGVWAYEKVNNLSHTHNNNMK